MIYTGKKKFTIDDKFKIKHRNIEYLPNYKVRKKENIKKIIVGLLLGAAFYGLAYTIKYQKEKIPKEKYENIYQKTI